MIDWPTRSGARSRWLPFPGPENTIPLADLLIFNIAFALLGLGALAAWFAYAGVGAVRAAADPNGELASMSGVGAMVTDGRWWSGTIAGDEPFCVVHHERQHGKSGWKRDWSAASASVVSVTTTWKGRTVSFYGREAVMAPQAAVAGDERRWRARFPDMPQGGRVREQCVGRGQGVMVEACGPSIYGEPLRGCNGRAVMVTPGDGSPQPRIDELAAWLAGRISMLGLALVLVLAYVWRLVRARPLAEALLRWAGRDQPSKRTFWVVVAALGVPAFIVLVLAIGQWTGLALVDRYGYAWGALGVCTALAFAHLVHERRKRLAIACSTLSSVATVGLREARGALVELAVRVRADAPVVPGPLTNKPRAWFGLQVERVHRAGKNHRTVLDHYRSAPALVPVEDASGQGFLDLSEASFDVRAVQRVARGRAAESPKLAAALRDLPRRHLYKAFLVEERYLEPGEQLFVLGAVQRIEPSTIEGGYRQGGSAPVIGPRTGAGMIVHAGTERSLVGALMLERRVVDVMLAVVLLTAVAVVGANLAMALQ